MIDGTSRQLPAAVDRAAYRIVQEALTNIRRHAGPGAAATVTIGYRPEALVVEVDDDGGARRLRSRVLFHGRGTASRGCGSGPPRWGGELTAGPAPDGSGGWRVRATLPLGSDETREATA